MQQAQQYKKGVLNMAWGSSIGSIAGSVIGGPIGGAIGGGIGGLIDSSFSGNNSKPKQPSRMDYDTALGQARDILTPQYERSRDNTMNKINNNLVSRGFYGQAPGDALRANAMVDMENNFQGQLANYATNMQDNRFNQDMQNYQMQMQEYNTPDPFWSGIGSIAGSFLGGPGGEATFNWLTS